MHNFLIISAKAFLTSEDAVPNDDEAKIGSNDHMMILMKENRQL